MRFPLFRDGRRDYFVNAIHGWCIVMATSRSARSMRASIAANERWSRTGNRNAATEPARDGFTARFEKMVDPASELPPDERARRASSAMKAHMTRLALRSAESRRAAASARDAARESARAARALKRTATDLEQVAADADSELRAIGGETR
jgi:hypothetical protein